MFLCVGAGTALSLIPGQLSTARFTAVHKVPAPNECVHANVCVTCGGPVRRGVSGSVAV